MILLTVFGNSFRKVSVGFFSSCRPFAALSLCVALSSTLSDAEPVLAWNNQSVPLLLPKALILEGKVHSLAS